MCTGGSYVPPDRQEKKKKSHDKVVKFLDDMYSVHSNKMYRAVCHIPPGEPATCSLKVCLASKELSERNNAEFSCSHIEDVINFVATSPQEELSTDECRFGFKIIIIAYLNIKLCQDSLASCTVGRRP